MTVTSPFTGSHHRQHPRLHRRGNEPEFSRACGGQPHLAGQNGGEEDRVLRRRHVGAPLPEALHGVRRNDLVFRVRLHRGE